MANFAVGLAFGDEFEHFGREPVRLDALAGPPSEHDARFDYPAVTITDYVILLKVDGEWRIANKVYPSQAKVQK